MVPVLEHRAHHHTSIYLFIFLILFLPSLFRPSLFIFVTRRNFKIVVSGPTLDGDTVTVHDGLCLTEALNFYKFSRVCFVLK